MEKKQELERFGIKCKGNVYFNLPTGALVEKSVKRGEGVLTNTGALLKTTGKYTGRSPNDRFIVDEPSVKDHIDWGKINVSISRDNFNRLYKKITSYLSGLDELYVFDGYAGADRDYLLKVRVVNELASQNLFIHQLLRRPDHLEELNSFVPGFTLLAAPGCLADPAEDGTNSEAFVIISFEQKVIIIGGTLYSGEMKKSIFSVMNYLLPSNNVLPMHCSANKGENDTALFFGLSGTGKTTLSADENRHLIGDDEHGWSENGIFNFEGGCYAKCINLTRENEPQIYDSLRFGAILENVVMDPCTRELDFSDPLLTENTRAGYPLEYISNFDPSGVGDHPKTIIFLTADAFGVLPPVAKLTQKQAMYHFISGYTSKLAGTERGIKEPQATFSSFFGSPFMPLKPMVYANLLAEKIEKHNTSVFLINTGWTGGPYGTGSRTRLSYTRAMITAALEGKLDDAEYWKDPVFKLLVPLQCPGIPQEILRPENTWDDKIAYRRAANNLAKMFEENFKRFEEIPSVVVDSGPEAIAA